MRFGITLLLVIAGLTGCGGNEFGATVSGVVTLDGNPVTPGFVTFAPENPADVPAVSDLDANGRFTLSTNKKPGVAPGKYRASVQAFKPPDLAPGERTLEPSEKLVPDRYFSVDTSNLEYTVEPGPNTIDIPLTSE